MSDYKKLAEWAMDIPDEDWEGVTVYEGAEAITHGRETLARALGGHEQAERAVGRPSLSQRSVHWPRTA